MIIEIDYKHTVLSVKFTVDTANPEVIATEGARRAINADISGSPEDVLNAVTVALDQALKQPGGITILSRIERNYRKDVGQ